MKIYIAAASKEIDRAEHAARCLREADDEMIITASWMSQIRQVGAANPRDANDEQRHAWALQCLREVAASDVLWFLVPPPGIDTAGAWGELVCAVITPFVGKIVCSGDTKRSIFCALGEEFATDAQALDYIVTL